MILRQEKPSMFVKKPFVGAISCSSDCAWRKWLYDNHCRLNGRISKTAPTVTFTLLRVRTSCSGKRLLRRRADASAPPKPFAWSVHWACATSVVYRSMFFWVAHSDTVVVICSGCRELVLVKTEQSSATSRQAQKSVGCLFRFLSTSSKRANNQPYDFRLSSADSERQIHHSSFFTLHLPATGHAGNRSCPHRERWHGWPCPELWIPGRRQ